MKNKIPNLLSPSEQIDIYNTPLLNPKEYPSIFSLNSEELKTLKTFRTPQNALYFVLCLTFFKLKHTFVDFSLESITPEINYIKNKYFHQEEISVIFPSSDSKSFIRNKVLSLCGFQRFSGPIKTKIIKDLQGLASNYPRQRQLCKELLNIFKREHIAIPGYRTLQDVVNTIWTQEQKRLIKKYVRATSKHERNTVLSLINSKNEGLDLTQIQKPMKSFHTKDLWDEIDKQVALKPAFEISKSIIPKLGLSQATVSYYASLIRHYSLSGLKQLHPHKIGIYILCYAYNRYQTLNDNLLEGFQKRTLEYQKKAKEYAKSQALLHLEAIKNIRERVSKLLLVIKNAPDPERVMKKELYALVPEAELVTAALLLVDEKFNKYLSFWKYIDEAKESIALNLRKLFLSLDFTITNNLPLQTAIEFVKNGLENEEPTLLPNDIKTWIGTKNIEFILAQEELLFHRLEFFLYQKICHHLKTNQVTLKWSHKHKKIEDELLSTKKWPSSKKNLLKELGYSKLSSPPQKILNEKKETLAYLFKTLNEKVEEDSLSSVKIKMDAEGHKTWSLIPLEALSESQDSLLSFLQQISIVPVMRLVNQKTGFCKVFESILPKSIKGAIDLDLIMAGSLAHAMRLSLDKMAGISDLNVFSLLNTSNACLRVEPIQEALCLLHSELARLPIYKEWYINGIPHSSLDGLKLGTRLKNIKARHSKKYFGTGLGVSSCNHIFNFFSIGSHLIGAHEYEGHTSFEMVHHQNISDLTPTHISTDKHGVNSLNFALFDLTDLVFCPRLPKPHREILWGFGTPSSYEKYFIKPTKFIQEDLILSEWDNIQRLIASLLQGTCMPSTLIRKLASKNYSSKMKEALAQYNQIVKTEFLLNYLLDEGFRRAILISLNRGESYNNLYRSIAFLNNNEFRNRSEEEMEICNQCTRLVAGVIHYYNAYILNSFYLEAKTPEEKKQLAKMSPAAWQHINLLGHYQFYTKEKDGWLEKLIEQHDWRESLKNLEKS